MKRAYSPKEIAKKTYKTLPWGGRWEESFGLPEENSTWFISGASASGKSSFVMQLAYELTHYGQVLYLSYEEGVSQSFQERMLRFELDKRQGWFRVVTQDTIEDLAGSSSWTRSRTQAGNGRKRKPCSKPSRRRVSSSSVRKPKGNRWGNQPSGFATVLV